MMKLRLDPVVVEYIWSDLDRMNDPQFLEALADRLETEVVVDETLPRDSVLFPGKGPGFRDDVMLLSVMLRTKAGRISMKPIPNFDAWVKTIIGVDLGNEEIHKKLTAAILADNADADSDVFRLALGRIIARASLDRVSTYHVQRVLLGSPSDCSQKLFKILKNVADGCVFTKLRA